MDCEWDPGKATANRRKHGVSFEEAPEVVRGAFSLTVDDLSQDREDREKTIGISRRGRVLVVIHMRRGGRIRIISARRADAEELTEYETEIRRRFKS